MKSKNPPKDLLAEALLKIMRETPNLSYNYKQLAAKLNIKKEETHQKIQKLLHKLHADKQIEEIERGKFKAIKKANTARIYEGTVDLTMEGNAYISCDELASDTFVQKRNTHHALHGDTVSFKLIHERGRTKVTGEVVEILKRNKIEFTGVLRISKNIAFVVPDGRKMMYEIFVPKENLGEATNGDKVKVKLLRWEKKDTNPTGKVIRVFGKPGLHETEMQSIISEFDLEEEFSTIVMREAEKLDKSIYPEEIKKRRDFREILTFTIDPEDAKDFDDALSYKKLPGGNTEVGVHIADVTHYIKPATHLEKEASERATSVYLVDRVIPMLPERLSNDLCSLRPREDKLTFSAVFEFDKFNNLVKEWYGKTIIYSDHRFAYDEVQEILESGKGLYTKELAHLNTIAKKFKEERFSHGAINFETDEIKIKLDDKGEPIGVYQKTRKDAHKLIEEFMLMANRKVAELLGKQKPKYPCVYRVHDSPDVEKLKDFSEFAQRFGYTVETEDDRKISQSINKLIKEIEGTPEQNILNHFAIRSMPKAYYTMKKHGHYGLAMDYYCHFTSPIRRYPDMMVHRLLHDFLMKKTPSDSRPLEKLCKNSSEKEVAAAEAERASVKMKQCEYMAKFIGKEFDGLISGTTEWGMYVQIKENKCEGMIRLQNMEDDMYFFDEPNYCIKGKRSGKKYRIGDEVKIKVWKSDPLKKQIDFLLVE